MGALTYREVLNNLNFGCAVVVFLKKTGEVRTMLCTRCRGVAELANCGDKVGLLNYRDQKFTAESGNLAVVDMIKEDVRAFNIDRVIYYEQQFVADYESINKAATRTEEIREHYAPLIEELKHIKSLDDMDLIANYGKPDKLEETEQSGEVGSGQAGASMEQSGGQPEATEPEHINVFEDIGTGPVSL